MEFFSYSLSIKDRIIEDFFTTLYMLIVSAVFVGIFGLILGVIMVVTDKGRILENKLVYNILDKLTNLFRAVPFIILLAPNSPLYQGHSWYKDWGDSGHCPPYPFGHTLFCKAGRAGPCRCRCR